MKLDGHESPLVGVNCPSNMNSFITCDTKGMVKVWIMAIKFISHYAREQVKYLNVAQMISND